MENIRELKKTNKALLVSNVVLGCLLILVMALFAIVIIDNSPISASAAEEGYVKGELVYENVELTPMTNSSSDTTKLYVFSTGYTSYETNKGYILTLQIDGQDVEIPVYTHTSKENQIVGSFDLVANYDLAGYIDISGNGRVIVIANGENRTFIVKSIHRYEKWDANVDYDVETSTGKEYKVEKNLAQNIILTKTKTENGLIYYESNVMLENITDYNSLSKLSPLTKIELNNGYKMMDRLGWEVTMEEGTYWTNPALYYNYSVAGMQVYYSQNKFTAILEGAEGPENLQITSIDIVKEKVANEMSADGIIGNITGAFTGFLTGTGGGIINFFDTIFLNEEGKLTILAIVGLSMMGLGIATGIIKYLLARVG